MLLPRRWVLGMGVMGAVAGLLPKAVFAAIDLKDFILGLVQRAIDELTGPNTSLPERARRLKAIFGDYFDMASAAKFVLGSYWRSASEEERKEFSETFVDYMSVAYGKRFGEYTGQKIIVDHIRQDNEKTATVFTLIDDPTSTDNPPINWVVRTDGNQPKIVDVQIAGLSLISTHRDEFAAVIARTGGVKGLIKTLKEKIGNTLQQQ